MDIVNASSWDSVLQFVADPLDLDFSEKAGVTRTLIQVPTPPVSTTLSFFLLFSLITHTAIPQRHPRRR